MLNKFQENPIINRGLFNKKLSFGDIFQSTTG